MLIYMYVSLIHYLLGILEILKVNKKLLMGISFFILSIFIGFNYLNGIDWVNYQKSFLMIRKITDFELISDLEKQSKKKQEILLYLLMSIYKIFSNNYEIFQFIIIVFNLFILYRFINESTRYKLITIAIYYNIFIIGNYIEPVLRQATAMSFYFLAILNYKKNKQFKGLIMFIVGIFFHNTLLVLIPTLFKKKINIKKEQIIILCFICFILSNNIMLIVNFIIVNFHFFEKYKIYFMLEEYGKRDYNIYIYIARTTTYISVLLYVNKNKNMISQKVIDVEFVIKMALLYILIGILAVNMGALFRIQLYFSLFYVTVFSYLIEILIKKYGRVITINTFAIIMLLYSILAARNMIKLNKEDELKYYPYSNYLLEVIKENNFVSPEDKIRYREEKVEHDLIVN